VTVDAQLASKNVPVLYLAQLDFVSGTQRLTNWSHNLPWAGHTWVALGSMVSVSAVKASERTDYPAMDLGLQVANNAMLALATGNPNEYRGRPVTVWHAFLDDQLRPLGDPEVCWAGDMDQVRLNTGTGEEGDGGSIVLRCEQQGKDTRAVRSLRLNNAQHQKRYPGDTFLSRIEGLNGKPVPWLSVRFQQI
jgi:hypothetical protein